MAMQMLVDELQARGVVDYGPPDPAAAPWLTGLRWQDMVKEINAMERPQDVFGEGELQWILALTATAAREPAEHLLTPAQMTRLTRLYSSVQGIEQF
jgi:hypothetical protein